MQGDALWALLEAEGHFFPDDLKLILKANRYDDLYSLIHFNDTDKSKLTEFMKKKLHKIVKDPALLERYYGIFKDCPEEFSLVGGQDKSLKRLVACAKQIRSGSSIQDTRSGSSEASSSSSQAHGNESTSSTRISTPSPSQAHGSEQAENVTEKILDYKKKLDETVNNYLKEAYPDQTLTTSCLVAQDNLGGYVAKVACPVATCGKMNKMGRNKARWSTSNFYAHVKTHSTEKKAGLKRKNTLDSFVTKKTSEHQEDTQENQDKRSDTTRIVNSDEESDHEGPDKDQQNQESSGENF